MPIALTPNETWNYTLKDDPVKTVFKLKSLDGEERETYMDSGLLARVLVRLTLRGWDLRDAAGQEIKFLTDAEGRCDRINLGYLSTAAVYELAGAVREHEKPSEGERKN
jgi:hypothetical protein